MAEGETVGRRGGGGGTAALADVFAEDLLGVGEAHRLQPGLNLALLVARRRPEITRECPRQ